MAARVQTIRIWLAADGIAEQPAATVAPEPEPTPEPTILPATRAWSIEEIVCSLPWPCWEALSVAECESRMDPNAVNPSSGAQGLFQLLPRFHAWRYAGRSPFDPQANVDAAYSLWSEQGWAPWSCQP